VVQIYHRTHWWLNFENLSTFGEDMDRSFAAHFFSPPSIWTSNNYKWPVWSSAVKADSVVSSSSSVYRHLPSQDVDAHRLVNSTGTCCTPACTTGYASRPHTDTHHTCNFSPTRKSPLTHWCPLLPYGLASCARPGALISNYKWRLNLVWHMMYPYGNSGY